MSELGLRLGRLLNRRPEMWRPFRYKQYGEGSPVVIIPGLDGVTEFFADITAAAHAAPSRDRLLPAAARRGAGGRRALRLRLHRLRHQEPSSTSCASTRPTSSASRSAGPWPSRSCSPIPRWSIASFSSRRAPTSSCRGARSGSWPCSRTCPRRCSLACTWATSASATIPRWAKEVFIRGAAWADHQSVLARGMILRRVRHARPRGLDRLPDHAGHRRLRPYDRAFFARDGRPHAGQSDRRGAQRRPPLPHDRPRRSSATRRSRFWPEA